MAKIDLRRRTYFIYRSRVTLDDVGGGDDAANDNDILMLLIL